MDMIIFFISVFLAGILSFFSPCILPLLPVYAGVLLDDKDGAQVSSGKFSISVVSLLRTLIFIAGISFIFIILGYGAGFLGDLLYASWFQYVIGAVIIFLGLHQMEVLHFQGLYKERRLQLKKQGQKGKGYSQAFLLGLTFSFAWTPCVGPVLSSVCLASLPDTDEIAKDAGDDYVVLTVVSPGHKGEQAETDFKNWYKGLDYKNFPVLIDPSGKFLESYGDRSYPTQAFIDKEGKLVKTQPGFMDKDMILKELKEMG